jgi:uncharacterized protein (TIGR02996 family)
MTHDEAFIEAIAESPDDEGLRLIYADWLEDQGESDRAELIQVECALAKHLAAAPNRHPLEYRARRLLCVSDGVFKFEGHLSSDLEARDHELLSAHAGQWSEPLRRFVEYVGFRRGFVEEVGMRGRTFLDSAEEMFRLAPIRHITFSRVPPVFMPTLASSPYLAGLSSLSLAHNRIGPRSARCLAESPHAAGLTTLDLTHCRIGDAGLKALVSSPYLTRLAALHLGNNDLGEASVRLLASSPNLPGLAYLSIGCNRFGEEGLLRERFGDGVHFGMGRLFAGEPSGRCRAAPLFRGGAQPGRH